MTRLLSFLRPCPLRVVTAEEIRAVAGSSREDTVQAVGLDGRRVRGPWADEYEAMGSELIRLAQNDPELLSNSRRWR